MAWRLAKSLDKLRSEVNAAYPGRSKTSDGTIGDAAHSSRASDHNPNSKGVVCAIDFTHDPPHGLNSEALAEALRASRDPRIKYILSNRKICSGKAGPSPWKWRKYTGKNPHDKHVHLSVSGNYDDTSPWNVTGAAKPAPRPDPVAPTVPSTKPTPTPEGDEKGDRDVWHVQRRLKAMNYNPGEVDGIWGGITGGAISGFINDRKLRMKAPTSAAMFKSALPELRKALAAAETESFSRPIAPERAEATPDELAPKLPEVKAAQKASFWSKVQGWWSSIFGGVAATTVVSNFMTAKETVDPIKSWFGETVPYALGAVFVGVVIVITIVLTRKATGAANEAADESTKAYQEGSRT